MRKDDQQYMQQMTAAQSYSIGVQTRLPILFMFFSGVAIQQIVSLVNAAQQHDMRHVWIDVGVLLLIFLCGVYFWVFSIRRQQVIIANEGIIYVTDMYTLYTPWENILRATSSPYGGLPALQLRTSAEALPIEQGIRERRAAIKMRLRGRRSVKIQSRYEVYNYIPLTNNREGGLWQDVRRHLPDLEMNLPATQPVKQSISTRIF
ncbi:hypothetical protein [Dictyobacter aurantiacus]|uniref:Uncharacterized protein n=1 Tax=Dictyobacter aurantiacus TaxID=1936993 RepID=A0A401ZKB4_9CHLR|nr:hypothetical protein [Dictyobacter aurantiacus]GCE07295.1 hypothetical protein KDAU_46240 [Dictyobacter aurantiacus]